MAITTDEDWYSLVEEDVRSSEVAVSVLPLTFHRTPSSRATIYCLSACSRSTTFAFHQQVLQQIALRLPIDPVFQMALPS